MVEKNIISSWEETGSPPRGWLSPAYKHIKDSLGDYLVGVEIGICRGSGTEYVIDGISLKKFYMVDPYVPYDFNYTTIEAFDEMYKYTLSKFEKYKNAILIRKSSEEASKNIDDNSVDFVYIDGNHFYPAVKKDIETWWPKVRSGGIMGGHDYDADVPVDFNIDDYIYTWRVNEVHYGVVKAVRDFAIENNIELSSGKNLYNSTFDWWIHKP